MKGLDRDMSDGSTELTTSLETLRAVSLGTEPLDKAGLERGTVFLYTGKK